MAQLGKMKLRVWGGLLMHGDGQLRRVILATKTKKRACEILDISLYVLNGWWAETGNKEELSIALKQPDTLFINMGDEFGGKKDFQRMEEK